MKNIFLFACILFFAASSAFADDGTCVALARIIGVNSSNSLTHDEQQSVYQASLCMADYKKATSDQRVQIQAAYELYSGSASSGDDQVEEAQSQSCQSQFGSYWQNKLITSSQKTVSAEGAAVIDTCLRMSNDYIFPSVMTANNGQEVDLTLQFKPSLQSSLDLIAFGPTDLVANNCSITKRGTIVSISKASDASQILKPTEGATISCKRKQAATKVNGVDYTCSQETIFLIATSGPSTFIKVPRSCTQVIVPSEASRLQKEIDLLNKSTAPLQGNITTVADNVTALEAYQPVSGSVMLSSSSINGTLSFYCAPGWTFEGAIYLSVDPNSAMMKLIPAAQVASPAWPYMHMGLCRKN